MVSFCYPKAHVLLNLRLGPLQRVHSLQNEKF